jgi:uncharacterized protein YcbK (DUF882 family)
MSHVLLTKLQTIRDIIDIPLVVNSGFRCKKHNQELPNSSPNSQHLLGKAVDISASNLTAKQKYKLMWLAQRVGMKGIGIYPTFFHFDTRDDEKLWVM